MDQSDFIGTGNWQFCAKWGLRALPDERTEAVGQLLEKEQTVEQIVSRFNLSSVQVVYGWIGRYIEESLLSDTSQKPEVDSKELTLPEALKEIKRLKKALDLEKMRSAGYSHMIELAEQHSTFRSEKIWHQTVGWLRSTWPRISLDKCCICQTLHQPFRSPVLCVGYLPTPIKPPGEVVHHFDVYRVEFGKALCQTRLYRLQVLR